MYYLVPLCVSLCVCLKKAKGIQFSWCMKSGPNKKALSQHRSVKNLKH